jgi:anti-sigma B factor antagonist
MAGNKKGEFNMSMKANVLRDALGNITVQMSGDLDYENSMPLRRELHELSVDNPHSKITVDLGGVDFVGSSGICHFVETLSLLNKEKIQTQKISLSNVSGDFKKVFKLYTMEESEIIWADMDSDDTEQMNTQFGNRKRTFQM